MANLRVKAISAADAIAKAKTNAVARKNLAARELRHAAFEAIHKMIDDGVVSCEVIMQEEWHWGLEIVKKELEDLGYKVQNIECEKETGIEDLEISIEHLK